MADFGSLEATIERMRVEMKANEERMAILKAGLEEMKSIVEHQEVSKEEAAVETFGTLKNRYGDRHLAVGRHKQLKKWAQGSGES
jgi:hypothetical protein